MLTRLRRKANLWRKRRSNTQICNRQTLHTACGPPPLQKRAMEEGQPTLVATATASKNEYTTDDVVVEGKEWDVSNVCVDPSNDRSTSSACMQNERDTESQIEDVHVTFNTEATTNDGNMETARISAREQNLCSRIKTRNAFRFCDLKTRESSQVTVRGGKSEGSGLSEVMYHHHVAQQEGKEHEEAFDESTSSVDSSPDDFHSLTDTAVSSVGSTSWRHEQEKECSDHVEMLEVSPGEFLPLRGSEETWCAIQTGNVKVVMCLVCNAALLCISDAELVICPDCCVLSPIPDDPPLLTQQPDIYHLVKSKGFKGGSQPDKDSGLSECTSEVPPRRFHGRSTSEKLAAKSTRLPERRHTHLGIARIVGGVSLSVKVGKVLVEHGQPRWISP